jgi:23S rRNA (cytosine1962-C5)-methyltransferase
VKELRLSPDLTTILASGHPWVYRDHTGNFSAPSGSWVRVTSGSFSAVGLWDDESAIAVRLFSTQGVPDEAWIKQRVLEAYDERAALRKRGVDGYRLLFGEADQLPGIVVDMYGEHAILVSYSKSLGGLLPRVAQAVMEVTGCRGVTRRTKQDDAVKLQVLCGEPAPQEVEVNEYGMKLVAELSQGQKTGLFFDHRENRAYVRMRSQDKHVLNLFSYTGGFSVAAALGGARSVTSVDISKPAIVASERNFALNLLPSERHEAISQDVFVFLEQSIKAGRSWDLVVCDPPSFAKNKTQLRAAEKAYRRLMSLALQVTKPGGEFCAASCTSQVGPSAFRLALVDAARKAKRRLKVIADVGQPIDHPVAVAHEEGRYLKFIASTVYERC